MGSVRTLAQRKTDRVEEIRSGIAILRAQLLAYAVEHRGSFVIYGSAVTGALHYDSDLDVLVDFPATEQAAALDFVETLCASLGLKADVQPKSWCKPEFLARIAPKSAVLP